MRIFLYANFLYGIAAVALAIESNFQLRLPLNSIWFYLLLFCGTILFYSFSYRYDKHPDANNQRAIWIHRHKKSLSIAQVNLVVVALVAGIMLLNYLPLYPLYLSLPYAVCLAIFPLIGILYYGISFPGILRFQLRQIGWLKPFIISLVWTGCVSFMPVVVYAWRYMEPLHFPAAYWWFFGHNFMFIGVLCILFDIKDYAADHNRQLKTFVVRIGLRRTIFYIILPLIAMGFIAFSAFLAWQDYRIHSLILNNLPILLLVLITFSLRQRRSIGYYLLAIDGMMVVKALFGVAAVLLR